MRPSTVLLLAQALASENADTLRDTASRREMRAGWQVLTREARRHWIRKARRVLARLDALGGRR